MRSTCNDLHSANYSNASLETGCKADMDAPESYLQKGREKKKETYGRKDLPHQRSDLRMLPTCLQREPPEIRLNIQLLLDVNVHFTHTLMTAWSSMLTTENDRCIDISISYPLTFKLVLNINYLSKVFQIFSLIRVSCG